MSWTETLREVRGGRTSSPADFSERRGLVLRATLALPSERASHAFDHLVESGPELGTFALGNDRLVISRHRYMAT